MANKYRHRTGPLILRRMPKSGTVAIEQGDLLKFNGKTTNLVIPCASAGDSTSFVGVAISASPAGNVSGESITVAIPGKGTTFEFDLATAGVMGLGDALLISAAQSVTSLGAIDLDATAPATNVVAVVSKDNASTSSIVQLEFLDAYLQLRVRAS